MMIRRRFFAAFALLPVLALPALGAMSDREFIELCESGTAEQVEDAIKGGANVNAKDKDGWTAFYFALVNNNLKGTDVMRRLMTDGPEGFIQFCAIGSPQEITDAIKAGADVNAKNDKGGTALMMAASSNNDPDVTAALLNAGADVNAKDKDGWTALMSAALYNTPEVIAALLNAGADVNAKDENGRTALMLAAWSNTNPEVIAALLNAGADVNAKDKYGYLGGTALMMAANSNNNPEVIAALLNAGADVNAKDEYGRTALDIARKNNNTAAVKVLEEAPARRAAEAGDAEAQYQPVRGDAMRYADMIK